MCCIFQDNKRPLHLAAMKGQLGVCRILLEFCADDKAVDNVSRRALNSTIEEKI